MIGNVKSNSIGLFGNRQSKATAEQLERYRYDVESGRTTEDSRWCYRYGAPLLSYKHSLE